MLKILPVWISGPDSSINTYAFLDDGSTVTLVDAQFAYDLGIRGEKVNINMKGIRDVDSSSTIGEKINFEIRSDDFCFKIRNALAASNLHLPSQTLGKELVRKIAKTQSVFIQPYENAQVKILIGQDNWRLLQTFEFREVDLDCALSRTPLGWTLHGNVLLECKNLIKSAQILSSKIIEQEIPVEDKLDELMKSYFDIDSLGVRVINSKFDKFSRAMKILETTSRRIEGGWETGLLWKSENAPLVDSRATAFKRLYALEKRLDRDSSYAELYYKEMSRFFDRAYASKVEEDLPRSRIWYIPHFGVTNASKPGKVRLVFDAAAKSSGYSLNDQLDTGPDLLQNLFGILIRFRQHAVAISSDIRDMYLRVKVRESDRGALRFLWRGRDRFKHPEVYEMNCLIFGANSSPTSAIYVKDANAKRFIDTMPEAATNIIRNSYVDDFLTSQESDAQAIALIRNVIKINAEANFEMHRWSSNHPKILESIKTQNNALASNQTPLGDKNENRMLGMFWDTKLDTLSFNVGLKLVEKHLLPNAKKPSKREFLKCVMSVYDPLGLLSPYILISKLIMQDVWRTGIGWDDQLGAEEYEQFKSWLTLMKSIAEIKITRCLSPTVPYQSVQLHAFCDASLKAYAAGVYIRFRINEETAHTVLVMAKSRIAPIKLLSIPRLELQAALLAARLLNSVEQELDLKAEKRFLWSDSQTVLFWIRAEPRTRHIYVAHRLGEINEITSINEWKWVPSKLNPADCATRGKCEDEMIMKMWFDGPKFLRENENSWPVPKSLSRAEKEALENLELRKTNVFHIQTSTSPLPFIVRLLGWSGLCVLARRVRKFFNKWRLHNRQINLIKNNQLELTLAEEYIIRVSQSESFNIELNCLRKKSKLPTNSKICNLDPQIDCKGILRANGRINNQSISASLNFPIILQGKHPAVELLVKDFHCRYKHSSNETVLNELKQTFYIIGARNVLKSVISRCLVCKLRRAKPSNPLMAPLPIGRLAIRQRPFSHCGVDYFGPLFVRVRRSTEKRWGVLLTCLTTRAIHLEVANSLTSDSAILALQRLSARFGKPTDIYSDNGTNFRGACYELSEEKRLLSEMHKHIFVLKNKIRWHFNPPDAPHMGGAWERMIRTVKISLYATLKNEAPNEEVLLTLLLEIAHDVNSRPLTHVTVDPRDDEALTPNHFLIGASSGNFRLGTFTDESTCTRKNWRLTQILASRFWSRWIREYLPTLLPRKK